jgi:hypothetical protein
MPFFCYNKDDYCDHSENCDGCDVWVKGKGGKEVPSNGDRIRAMTDESLAEWINDTGVICNLCAYQKECDAPCSRETCINGIAKWLQQPAEEVHADG